MFRGASEEKQKLVECIWKAIRVKEGYLIESSGDVDDGDCEGVLLLGPSLAASIQPSSGSEALGPHGQAWGWISEGLTKISDSQCVMYSLHSAISLTKNVIKT